MIECISDISAISIIGFNFSTYNIDPLFYSGTADTFGFMNIIYTLLGQVKIKQFTISDGYILLVGSYCQIEFHRTDVIGIEDITNKNIRADKNTY